nr:SpvB/TcaC N-terminal domain-containing protein [Bacteroidales bacterium]
MINRIIFTLLLIGLSFQAIAQDTIIIQDNVVLNSNYSSFNNVTVVGIDGVTINNGFQYSSNGTGELIIDGDPMGIQSPDGNAPYYNPAIPGSNPKNLDLSLPVGTIPGSAGVSSSGAATYSIPIQVPLGNQGMEPQLGIVYNSKAGNGLLGTGWSLQGLSAIMAGGKSYYYDGMNSLVSAVDSSSRIYWDGQRLFGINEPGLAADSFRTEIVTKNIIEKKTGTNGNYFKIKTSNGKTLVYGSKSTSKMMLDQNTEWIWMLDSVYDRLGNTIVYEYITDALTKEILISEIKYGGAVSNPVNSIQFHYSSRSDISYAYINDDRTIQTKILDSIAIYSESTFYGATGFRYDISSGSTLLEEVYQYDKDQYYFNPTIIDWDIPTFNPNQTPSAVSLISGTNLYKFTGDFTGDGISDLVSVKLDFANDDCRYYLYKGTLDGLPSSYDESEKLPRSYTYEFWDYFINYFSSSNGCNYTGPPNLSTDYDQEDIAYVFSGDFDGDGIQELMVKVREWGMLWPYLPDDLNSGFESTFPNGFGGFVSSICNYSVEFCDPSRMVLNKGLGHFINFDKSPTSDERIHTKRLGSSITYKKQYSAFPDLAGLGYNSFPDNDSIMYYDPVEDKVWSYCAIPETEHRWGDFNGDGAADLINPRDIDFQIYLFNKETKSYSLNSTKTGNFIGTIDINNDGTDAYVYF